MKKPKREKVVDKYAKFWCQRATNYDKLFWTKDEGYLNLIIKVADFKKSDLVLDVGVGTGAFAKKIRKFIWHVIGIDISESMLKKGRWDGISAVKWDIRDALFANEIFDKVIARMCFHHIIDNLDLAIKRCYDLLKKGGRIIVAEGMPPSDIPEIIDWYANMFKIKEERLIFTEQELKKKLADNGFKKIVSYHYKMQLFSIKNWLVNSGLSKNRQELIMELHKKAPPIIKDSYNMRDNGEDCLVDTKNVIIVGIK